MSLNYASLTSDINVFDNFASVPQVTETMADIPQEQEQEVLVSSAPIEGSAPVEESTPVEEGTVLPSESLDSVGAPVEEENTQQEEVQEESKPVVQRPAYRPTQSWNAVFNLFDGNKDGVFSKYDAMLLLACMYDQPVTSIQDSQLLADGNMLNIPLEGVTRAQFVTACKQARNADGSLISSTAQYHLLGPNISKYHNAELEKQLSTPPVQVEEEETETAGGLSIYNIIIIILIIVLLSSLLSNE